MGEWGGCGGEAVGEVGDAFVGVDGGEEVYFGCRCYVSVYLRIEGSGVLGAMLTKIAIQLQDLPLAAQRRKPKQLTECGLGGQGGFVNRLQLQSGKHPEMLLEIHLCARGSVQWLRPDLFKAVEDGSGSRALHAPDEALKLRQASAT